MWKRRKEERERKDEKACCGDEGREDRKSLPGRQCYNYHDMSRADSIESAEKALPYPLV